MKKLFALVLLVLTATQANASSVVGLTTILTNDDCRVLSQVISMLSTNEAMIESRCVPGSYGTGDTGKYYKDAAFSELTFEGAQVGRPIPMQSLVTAGDCEYLARSFKLLATAQVDVVSACTYGSFKGSDGRIYPAKIDSAIKFNFALTRGHRPAPRKAMKVSRAKIGVVRRALK